MPTSAKKVEANRRNAQKSTGPKTPQGKARSSLNAVKHGLYARRYILNTRRLAERPDDFQCLRTLVSAKLDPQSPLERYLTHQISNLLWQLKRQAANPPVPFRRQTEGVPIETTLLPFVRHTYKRLVCKRRLRRRLDRSIANLCAVKQSHYPDICQQLENAMAELEGGCQTNPPLERVI